MADEIGGDYRRELEKATQLAPVFAAGGIVFVLTSLNLLVFSSLPLQLADAFWQLRLVGGLITNGLNLLIGAMLICLASVFSRSNPSIKNLAKLCRKICYYLAIFYLLAIPLQVYLGYKSLKVQSNSIQSGLATWPNLIRSIKSSQSPAELNSILLSLPEPRSLAAKLPDTFENVRSQVASSYQSQYNAAQEKANKLRSDTLQTTIGEVLRNSFQSLLLFFGFGSVGQSSPNSPSISQRFFGGSTKAYRNQYIGVEEE